jgi:hypothetical protein
MRPACAALLLTACSGFGGAGWGDGDDSDEPIPAGDGDTSDEICGGGAPEILKFEAEYEGISEGAECEGVTLPVVGFAVDVTDPDGDLDFCTTHLWIDTVVDGQFDVDGPHIEMGRTLGDDCEVFTTTLSLSQCVNGERIPYTTEVEFGLVVVDAAGQESNGGVPVAVVFTTPDVDGEF